MTAALRSLHEVHPGKYLVNVDTTCNALFEHSPDIASPDAMAAAAPARTIWMHTDSSEKGGCDRPEVWKPDDSMTLINKSNQVACHNMEGYCRFLETALGVRVPLLTNRPHVWLSEQEKNWLNQVEEQTGVKQKFWLVNAGVKQDFTCKQYPFYQEVVDRLQGRVLFVQIGKTEHVHRPLRGVVNLLGKTDDRQLIRLVYHCQGTLSSTTFLMHLGAAFEKPGVVIAGGREPRSWNSYPKQMLLSCVGALPCCREGGCWRSRTVKVGDGSEQDGSLCEAPCLTEPPAPRCMTLFGPEEVAEAVARFENSA
jgi:ADP-heptose:LPS heptosyltransferase